MLVNSAARGIKGVGLSWVGLRAGSQGFMFDHHCFSYRHLVNLLKELVLQVRLSVSENCAVSICTYIHLKPAAMHKR